MTKAPTGFFTLQALTALSSAAIIGVAGFLAQQSALEEEQQTAQEAQQEALVGQAVALKVAEITVQQQAEVDAALATVETLRQEYEAALDRAQRVSVAAAPPPAASATAPASTPPSPSPSAGGTVPSPIHDLSQCGPLLPRWSVAGPGRLSCAFPLPIFGCRVHWPRFSLPTGS
jgi:hypothetical protein